MVMVSSNQGLRVIDGASGEMVRAAQPQFGQTTTVAHPTIVYETNKDGLGIGTATSSTLVTDSGIPVGEPYRTISPPGERALGLGRDLLYGRGVLYLSANGYVYGFSGTLPEERGSID